MTTDQTSGVRRVVVVGGGTAGYLTALAIRRQLPALQVTLIESSQIPIIGVGEATTTLMPPFLHGLLGIDIVDLYREVRPTWKLGIRFDWGPPEGDGFCYPFGAADPLEAWAQDRSLANQSLCAMMMAADRVPIVVDAAGGEPRSLLPQMPFAYHLDNASFVALLSALAPRAGIDHLDATIADIVPSADRERIERLILADGREVRGDLYIDASGFRALLIEQALGSPFISFAPSLFCDGAIVGDVPRRGPIQPYTTAQTMKAGWCWRIPVERVDHRGYVYSSAHLTADEARDEMRAANPGLGDTWTVRFRSGRHREFWKGNTVAVGNAYGFVEPLQSTGLHMVIIEIAHLIAGLQNPADGAPDRAAANRAIGEHWDYLRWFLAIHYKFNQRVESEFWRDCRGTADVSGCQSLLDHHRAVGPWDDARAYRLSSDPCFGSPGLLIMLLGQQVPCPPPRRTAGAKADWAARVAADQARVDRALSQAPALQLLRRRPELLTALLTFDGSWLRVSASDRSGEWRKLQQLVRRGMATRPNSA